MLCIFTACSKDKDEPKYIERIIPYFNLEGEKPYTNGIIIELSAEEQTLSVLADSNTPDVKVTIPPVYVWVEYKDMIWKPEEQKIEFVFKIYPNPTDRERVGGIIISSTDSTDPYMSITPRTITLKQAGLQ